MRPTRTRRPTPREVRGFPEGPDAIAAVTTGQVDAAIIDQPVAVDAVEKAGGVEVAAEIPTNELYGIAISKDNPGLLEGVNGALVAMKEEGFFDDLYEQYFQSTPPDSVINGTTDEPRARRAADQDSQEGRPTGRPFRSTSLPSAV